MDQVVELTRGEVFRIIGFFEGLIERLETFVDDLNDVLDEDDQ